MATEGLNDDEIYAIVNQETGDGETDDETNCRQLSVPVSDDEPDGLIEGFRTNDEQYNDAYNSDAEEATNVALDVDDHSSDDDMTLQELAENLRRLKYVKELEIPRVLYGKDKNNRHKWNGEQATKSRNSTFSGCLQVFKRKY